MSNLKLCQGPDCHTYHTQDRLKGTKLIGTIKKENEDEEDSLLEVA